VPVARVDDRKGGRHDSEGPSLDRSSRRTNIDPQSTKTKPASGIPDSGWRGYFSEVEVYRETWWFSPTGWIEIPLRRVPGRGPFGEGHFCCPRRWWDPYNVRKQNLERKCDCDAEAGDLRSSGAENIRITDSVPYPNEECCKFIHQFGVEELNRMLAQPFFRSQFDWGSCYQLVAVGEAYDGRAGGV